MLNVKDDLIKSRQRFVLSHFYCGNRKCDKFQHELCAGVNKSDECIEVNLSTIFQSIYGTKQYWFHRSSELKCMLREWGSNSLHYFRLCCAEYDSEHIARYLREVNPPNVPVSKCCTEDPILVS